MESGILCSLGGIFFQWLYALIFNELCEPLTKTAESDIKMHFNGGLKGISLHYSGYTCMIHFNLKNSAEIDTDHLYLRLFMKILLFAANCVHNIMGKFYTNNGTAVVSVHASIK